MQLLPTFLKAEVGVQEEQLFTTLWGQIDVLGLGGWQWEWSESAKTLWQS